jgi:RimJ/RimL family protein N-acetyltransferase
MMVPDRQEAWRLVCEYTPNESLRRHMLAVETAMRTHALDPLVCRIADNSDLHILQSELNPSAWRRLARWLDLSCTKPSWIILSLARGALVEALVLLTHPAYGIPLEFVRLFRQPTGEPMDRHLFRSGIDCAEKCGAKELFYSTSEDFSEREIIRGLGFSHWREIYCYKSTGCIISAVNDCCTVEARMFAQTEIIALIERSSECCGDSQTKYFHDSLGSYGDAKLTLETMELASHDPCWWLVALGPDDQPVGLVLPVLNYGELTIGFIGVAPDFRGRGIASCLLKQLLPIANRSGYSAIYAEVDQKNRSMQKALAKSGFRLECRKDEWRLTIGDLEVCGSSQP